jgi:hypothetical protein
MDRGSIGQAIGSGSYAVLHRSLGTSRLGVQRGRGVTTRLFHNGGTVAQRGGGVGEGQRKEKGSFTGSGSLYSG